MNWESDLQPLQLANKFWQILGKSMTCFGFAVFFFLSFAGYSATEQALPQANSVNFFQYLEAEKNRLAATTQALKQKTAPTTEAEYLERMRFLNALRVLNQAKVENLTVFLDNQTKQQNNINQQLKLLQQLPPESDKKSIEEQVNATNTLLTLNKQTLEMINANLSRAKTFQLLVNDELIKLRQWHVNFQLEQQLKHINEQKQQLKQELEELYKTNASNETSSSEQSEIETQAQSLISNQHIALIQIQLDDLNLQEKIVNTYKLRLASSDTKTLQTVIDGYADAVDQYNKLIMSLQSMSAWSTSDAINQLAANSKNSIQDLHNKIAAELKTATQTKNELSLKLVEFQNQYKKIISTRQSLSQYRLNTWPNIIHRLMSIPGLFYKAAKILVLKVYDSYRWLDVFHVSLLWILLTTILAFFVILNQFLKSLASNKERSRLTGYLYDGILRLIQLNTPLLCLFFMLLAAFYSTHISFIHYELFVNLFMVWFIFRGLIIIARLILLERVSDYSGKDVKLYYRIKWMLLFGGWTTALMTFSHMLPLSLLLQDIFNRLFMLFILTVSLVAWRSRGVIVELLSPLTNLKKRYIQHAISLLVIFIPITLFTTALIGLSGFFNLAWSMSRYQAYIVMILVGYVLARGLLFDALEFISEWMISSLHNGWLWIEVFLKPLDKIIRIVLIALSFLFLFGLFGWYTDALMMHNLEKFAKYSLVNFPGIHITVESAIEFLLLMALLVWLSKWTREFCYRWLYINTKDQGIRNSLSVFTQYALILLGSYITLRVLGLEFSGMSMILGGLAVGMGFGLKDFANNIVGGIMLLIERPVREGDLITIGEYEGQVAHIGIRSMRVSSWDNTEVLIPNAETFNKPFINWTHQDGIVRTVVPIKVSRADDPVVIQQLILDVLAIVPEIEPMPATEVFLKKIDEALIEFEIRYFINVHRHTRYEVRSKVLFAITAQFKAAGIRPPVDPIAIEFKEGLGDFVIQKNSTDE